MARPALPLAVDDTPLLHIANRFHSVAIHLLRWARAGDRETGLSPERLSVLSVLTFGGPRTVTELAEAELVTPPAISRMVSGLERDGLAVRERVPEDRRYVRIRVTDAGSRLVEEARARRLKRIATRLERLHEDQLRVISDAAEMLEALEEEP